MDNEMASNPPETPCPSRGGRKDMQNDAGLINQERPIDSTTGSSDCAELVDINNPITRSDAGSESDERSSEDEGPKMLSSASSSSAQRSHDDDSDTENSSTDPDRDLIDARNLPLITNMDPLPNALAGRPLGQEIKAVAGEIRGELLGPAAGAEYCYHRPAPDPDPDSHTRLLWDLHIQPEINMMITHIISMNIETLNRISSDVKEGYAQLKQRSFQLTHLSALPETDAAWLRDRVSETAVAMEEHEAWEGILAVEIEMSNVALERMTFAGRGDFLQYQERRAVLWRLARQVYDASGSSEFVERHGNELWDVVLV